MGKLFNLLLLFVFGQQVFTFAGDSLSQTIQLPTKTVSSQASHSSRNLENAIVISKESWEGTGKSLADVIQEHSGIRTRKYGGEGSFQTVSIRGVSGSKIKVYLDDTPINSANGDAVDLGKINPASVEKIVIYKGFIPGRFGGNSLGGLIQLITSGQKQNKLHGEISLGSFETRKINLGLTRLFNESYDFSSSLSYRESRNNFPYLDRNNTPYNQDDDKWVRQKNGQFAQWDGHHSVNYTLYKTQNQLSFSHSQPEGGLPGKEGMETHTSGFKNPSYQWTGKSRVNQAFSQDLDVQFSASYRQELSRFFWSEEDGLTWSGTDKEGDVGSFSQQYLASGDFFWKPFSNSSLEGLLGGSYQTLKPKSFSEFSKANGWENNRANQFISLEGNQDFLKNFRLNFIGRLERIESNSEGGLEINGTRYSPQQSSEIHHALKSGLSWKPRTSLKLFSNLGSYYKQPSMLELYGGKWGVLPNPKLKEEKGLNMELGAHVSYGKSNFLELILFQNTNSNSIYYVRSANLIKPMNLDASQTLGLEISSSIKLFKPLFLENNITVQNPRNVSDLIYDDKLIPNEPVVASHSSLGVEIPHSGVLFKLNHDYSSLLYRDKANLHSIPAIHLWHLYLKKQIYYRIDIVGEIRNLTDVYYENAYSAYPYPGRQINLSLQFK